MTGTFFWQLVGIVGDAFKLNGPPEDDTEPGVANDDQASGSFPALTEQQSSSRTAASDSQHSRYTLIPDDTQAAVAATSLKPDHEDVVMGDLQSSHTPPLTAPYLQVFSHPGREGAEGSAMSLTDTLIWQLNTVFRCENKIARLLAELKKREAQQAELETMLDDLHRQRNQVPDGEDPTEQVQMLEYAQDLAGDLESERNELLHDLQHTEHEMNSPKADMYRDLKEVMGRYNLLEDISGRSDSGHVPWNQVFRQQQQQNAPAAQPPTPTTSEAARYAQEDAREEARDFKTKKEIDLQDARAKIDNWTHHYDDKYGQYRAMVDEGTTDLAKTEFDIILLGHQREATRDLVEAEQEYDAALQQARALGVVFWDPDQESQFPDNADDGYRISMEHDMVQHVDRVRIERWMAEKEDRLNHSTDCDDWEAKSIDICDSISLVAEGKDRSRINRWQATCDEQRAEQESPEPPLETRAVGVYDCVHKCTRSKYTTHSGSSSCTI
ncbi:hypothetical protein LHYA1_G003354 [Lachnellula hyalina]|uniref:Uncharacterized protein n=1 Tax=Lachnellula hyalina TaxID=1316788 RepID=A0A8H8TZU3_9HELO|nr:uncharacterized protein LHYA1_G003354 [Lachnellula hyalina]TVY28197.1 hypothetical protein LHYA1_G003354 [Lachnellula hyalina]